MVLRNRWTGLGLIFLFWLFLILLIDLGKWLLRKLRFGLVYPITDVTLLNIEFPRAVFKGRVWVFVKFWWTFIEIEIGWFANNFGNIFFGKWSVAIGELLDLFIFTFGRLLILIKHKLILLTNIAFNLWFLLLPLELGIFKIVLIRLLSGGQALLQWLLTGIDAIVLTIIIIGLFLFFLTLFQIFNRSLHDLDMTPGWVVFLQGVQFALLMIKRILLNWRRIVGFSLYLREALGWIFRGWHLSIEVFLDVLGCDLYFFPFLIVFVLDIFLFGFFVLLAFEGELWWVLNLRQRSTRFWSLIAVGSALEGLLFSLINIDFFSWELSPSHSANPLPLADYGVVVGIEHGGISRKKLLLLLIKLRKSLTSLTLNESPS